MGQKGCAQIKAISCVSNTHIFSKRPFRHINSQKFPEDHRVCLACMCWRPQRSYMETLDNIGFLNISILYAKTTFRWCLVYASQDCFWIVCDSHRCAQEVQRRYSLGSLNSRDKLPQIDFHFELSKKIRYYSCRKPGNCEVFLMKHIRLEYDVWVHTQKCSSVCVQITRGRHLNCICMHKCQKASSEWIQLWVTPK